MEQSSNPVMVEGITRKPFWSKSELLKKDKIILPPKPQGDNFLVNLKDEEIDINKLFNLKK